ncbi:MAG: DUF359 domain-containing protein [Candidatus Anstonellales archaeon]
MLKITEELRVELKKPLGRMASIEEVLKTNKKIIAVGDIVVLSLLEKETKPFVAVFDFKNLRKEISEEEKQKLISHFPNAIKISNPAGTLNEEIFKIAEGLLKTGGALFVDGEEDLVALAFLRSLEENFILIYGIFEKGVVAVDGGEKTKKMAEGIIKRMVTLPSL